MHAREARPNFGNERCKTSAHVLETRRCRMLDCACERGFGNPDRYCGTSNLEPRKNNFKHGLEATSFFSEARRFVHRAFEFHRRAEVAAQPESFPFANRVDAGSSPLHEIERGLRYPLAADGPCRNDVVIRATGAGDERLGRIDLNALAVLTGAADGRPEVTAASLLAERQSGESALG